MTLSPQSNGARFAAVPLTSRGTAATQWHTADLPRLDLRACGALVLVAPHPDDETLGLGATAAQLAASGIHVQIVSVSDGGAAYAGMNRVVLETTRRQELSRAAAILGVDQPLALGLPDGQLADHESQLVDLLAGILEGRGRETWCAATWRGDGHPDHESVGRAAAAAAARAGVTFMEYPVWMWHWATPADPEVPWHRACAIPLTDFAIGRKVSAAQCFRSQFEAPDRDGEPVLPAFVLRRLLSVGEVVFQ